MEGEFRLVFDTIPEQFDRYRPRYSEELFRDTYVLYLTKKPSPLSPNRKEV